MTISEIESASELADTIIGDEKTLGIPIHLDTKVPLEDDKNLDS